MGYLIVTQPFSLNLGDGRLREFKVGTHADVSDEIANHWYTRACGARLVESLVETASPEPSPETGDPQQSSSSEAPTEGADKLSSETQPQSSTSETPSPSAGGTDTLKTSGKK